MSQIYKGRQKILTSILPTIENIPTILNAALQIHNTNKGQMDYLINYALGDQPILTRVKEIRSEICNNTVFNLAFSSCRTIIGYVFGQPIQYTLRTSNKDKELKEFNDFMDYENSHAVNTEIAWFASIVGVGYKASFPDTSGDKDEVPFELMALDPRNTFEVLSTELGNKTVLTCSITQELDSNSQPILNTYTVYTDEFMCKYKAPVDSPIGAASFIKGSLQKNAMKGNPIKAYYNNQFLIGDFEIALGVLDAINTIGSNSIDDIEQIVQSILVLLGIDQTQIDTVKDLKSGGILAMTGTAGIQQDAKFIFSQLDSTSVKNFRDYLEEMVKQIIGIPDRKTRGGGGGDTGDAVKLRDGWADLEIVARNKEMFWKKTDKEQLKIILKILHIKGKCKALTPIDIDAKFTRNKMDNIATKTQAGSTMYAMGIDKHDVATTMDLTTDTIEFVKRWEAAEALKQKQVITDKTLSV